MSVAPSGLVWAVTWHGSVLIRRGVSALDPTGVAWCEIGAPRPETPLSIVSLGASIVWSVARDGSVWFRQGFKSSDTTNSDTLIKGTKWIKMVGSASTISVGPGDQVFCVCSAPDDNDTRLVQMRTGVQSSDISGKSWKTISAKTPFQHFGGGRYRSSSESSRRTRCSSDSSYTCSSSYDRTETLSTASASENVVDHAKTSGEPPSTEEKGSEPSRLEDLGSRLASSAGDIALSRTVGMVSSATIGRVPVVGPIMASATSSVLTDELRKFKLTEKDNTESKDISEKIDESMYVSAVENIAPPDTISGNSSLENTDTKTRERRETSMSDNESHTGRFLYDDDGELIGPGEPQWLWLSAGSCNISPVDMPSAWQDTNRKVNR